MHLLDILGFILDLLFGISMGDDIIHRRPKKQRQLRFIAWLIVLAVLLLILWIQSWPNITGSYL